ncbi:hypothetical protein J2S22_000555 [Rhodoplanes tepidamans]|nr:hypothetical protein [Rhodoplanes tepidamans]
MVSPGDGPATAKPLCDKDSRAAVARLPPGPERWMTVWTRVDPVWTADS